ncbi:MAG: dethiobiotin synthase [Balneolaceae bacterium]|nr:dethiobiotin synthase [Balneolaceae bacterium]
MKRFPTSFFVTGTDTGIGKTVVSAMLAQGLDATYWKPVQSGLQEETDTEFVKRTTNLPASRFVEEEYRLTEPLSPHASAAIDGITISMDRFSLPDYQTRHLVVEGAGGLMVPLNDEYMIIDLIKYLNLPVLLVSRSELGTLNHTFLSLEALRSRGIEILGVVMNGTKNDSNRRAIENYGNVSVLAELEPLERVTSETLRAAFKQLFDEP